MIDPSFSSVRPRSRWSTSKLALALVLGGCAATQAPDAGHPGETAPPPGAIAVGDELYQVPVGEIDGCPIYRLYSPNRLVPQAIYYQDAQNGFTMNRNEARCANRPPAATSDADG